MSRIHIARDRQPLGNFSPDEVADGLKSGRFFPTDLAWREPMDAWKSLGEFTDLPEPEKDDDLLAPLPPLRESVAPEPEKKTEIAWENRKETGVVAAVTGTISQVLGNTTGTFRTMRKDGTFESPLLYYVVLSTLGTWMALIYRAAALKIMPAKITGFEAAIGASSMGAQITQALFTPFVNAIGAFIAAGIIHVVVLALGGDEKRYIATFRAYCYAVGTAYVFALIPLCGPVIFFISAAVLLAYSLREVHGIGTGKAIVAMILPAILYILVMGVCVLLLAAAGAQGAFK